MGRFSFPKMQSGVTDNPATAIRSAGRAVWDVLAKVVRVHDGETAGGIVLARKDLTAQKGEANVFSSAGNEFQQPLKVAPATQDAHALTRGQLLSSAALVAQANIFSATGNRFTQPLVIAPATESGHAATLGQVAGLAVPKLAVDSAAAGINLASPGAAIAGVTMSAGMTFLLYAEDGSAGATFGPYVWNGAATAATRDPRADTAAELGLVEIYVRSGDKAGVILQCVQKAADISAVGTTPIGFRDVGKYDLSGVSDLNTYTRDRVADDLASLDCPAGDADTDGRMAMRYDRSGTPYFFAAPGIEDPALYGGYNLSPLRQKLEEIEYYPVRSAEIQSWVTAGRITQQDANTMIAALGTPIANIGVLGHSWVDGSDIFTKALAKLMPSRFGAPGAAGGGLCSPWRGSAMGDLNYGERYVFDANWTVNDPVLNKSWLNGVASTYGGAAIPSPALIEAVASFVGAVGTYVTPAGCTGAKLLWKASQGSTLQYSWDGQTWYNLTASSSTLRVDTIANAPAQNTGFTVRVGSGVPHIYGVIGTIAAPGIRWHKIAAAGSQLSDWLAPDEAEWAIGIAAMALDGMLVFLDVNDALYGGISGRVMANRKLAAIARVRRIYPTIPIMIISAPETLSLPAGAAGDKRLARDYQLWDRRISRDFNFAHLNLQRLFGRDCATYGNGGRQYLGSGGGGGGDDWHPTTKGRRVVSSAIRDAIVYGDV